MTDRWRPEYDLMAIERARLAVEREQQDLNDAIHAAFANREASGWTVTDIAQAAGLSRPRIYQMVKDRPGNPDN